MRDKKRTGKLLIIAAIVAAVVFVAILTAPKKSSVTNSEMLFGHNSTPLIIEQNIAYVAGAKGYYAHPAKPGEYPGVVMIHENRGLRPETRQAADALAKEGYHVLAVDLFGTFVDSQEDAKKLTSAFNQQKGVKNMQAAVQFLHDRGALKVASLGWCFGGKQSLMLATSGTQLNATVVYYGGGMPTTIAELKPITWPVLGVFGDQDQVLPIEKVHEFETSLNELNIENEIYVYEGVGHAFANPSGMNFAAKETKDAWKKTLVFLDKHLK